MSAKIENASKSKGEDEVANDIEEPLLIANDEGRQISVVAPSNMEEGFTFEAAVDGRLFVVTVPKGGVLMGETIMIPYPNEEDFSDFSANPHSIPTGYWRDGPFDLCVHGRTHPSACCSIICPASKYGSIPCLSLERKFQVSILTLFPTAFFFFIFSLFFFF